MRCRKILTFPHRMIRTKPHLNLRLLLLGVLLYNWWWIKSTWKWINGSLSVRLDKTYKRKLVIRPEPTKRQYASIQLGFQVWSNLPQTWCTAKNTKWRCRWKEVYTVLFNTSVIGRFVGRVVRNNHPALSPIDDGRRCCFRGKPLRRPWRQTNGCQRNCKNDPGNWRKT
jgi:hypothetical protein